MRQPDRDKGSSSVRTLAAQRAKWGWLAAIEDDPDVGHNGWCVAVAISQHLREMSAWPHQSTIGARARMSESSVRRGLRELERARYLVTTRGQYGNSYEATRPEWEALDEGVDNPVDEAVGNSDWHKQTGQCDR